MDVTKLQLSDHKNDESKKYRILTVSEVVDYVREYSKAVSDLEIHGLSPQIVKLLLDHYSWDCEKLITELRKNKKSVLKKAMIKDPAPKTNKVLTKIAKRLKMILDDDNVYCKFCNDPLNLKNSPHVSHCKHNYCTSCWSFCVNIKVTKSIVKCPEDKCLVEYDTIMHYILKSKIPQFQRVFIEEFIKNHERFSWCPVQNCTYVIKITKENVEKVICKCGFIICFLCKHEWHTPITCSMFEAWRRLREKQTGSKYTKICPTCTLVIKFTDNCPSCSTDKEDQNKLLVEPFYRFSDMYRLYQKENDFLKYKNNWDSFISESDDQAFQEDMKEIVNEVMELRGVLKCCIVFLYFLKRNTKYAESFCTYLITFRLLIKKVVARIRHLYLRPENRKFVERIKEQLKRGQEMKTVLQELCVEGYQKKWWSFIQEIQ